MEKERKMENYDWGKSETKNLGGNLWRLFGQAWAYRERWAHRKFSQRKSMAHSVVKTKGFTRQTNTGDCQVRCPAFEFDARYSKVRCSRFDFRYSQLGCPKFDVRYCQTGCPRLEFNVQNS